MNHVSYDNDDNTIKGPDHCVVIKYVPYVGDSKRAMDEYTSEIFLGKLVGIFLLNIVCMYGCIYY